ncbi:FtsK/SpoIIIE family DNA translocase [Prevotella pallens]|jgi:ftsK/spoIIIE family protein|uniref:S-DNA-T family DNA segregation ATPase FtsK/SpoIIIE n=2 Tax=Prevotella pallens TaxID=60133 RepID=A0ABX9DU05_9BACT|nr:DNA translocase FtsK [Prevotella pallens]EGQ12780.1 FtsK/SpoIIIE family protein [Prevotella pallens ATCC 700821]RAS48676.1 S-DNA-T family DNA segregation ATPase FtsK/SpoIIIE [Prevotella pallens]
MAKKKKEKTPKTFSEAIGAHYIINDKTGFVLGIVLLCLALYVLVAFISYFSTGEADQSLVTALRPGEIENSTKVFQNSCGSVGALLSYFLIARCFGIPAFIIPLYIILCGVRMIKAYEKINLWKWFFGMALIMVWSSITFAKFLTPLMGDNIFNPGGDHGAFVVEYVENIIGSPGLIAILAITMIAFLTYLTSETITVIKKLLNPVGYLRDKVKFTIVQHNIEKDKIGESTQEMETAAVEKLQNIEAQTVEFLDDDVPNVVIKPNAKDKKNTKEDDSKPTDNSEIGIEVDIPEAVEKAQGKVVAGATDLTSPINPHEPFINWKYPTLNLLKQYDSDNNVNFVDKEELEANKNRIIKVLNDFGVQIRSIRATVGPTITLYEITPAQGVRISKIKNLEDDIALSLAAIGIRIIAPMPGKGTIGIEVPNAKPSIVSMFSILNSRKFQESTMELPIALGKTITNDVYMVDLAKIPHLLVAGATGQGKSVGLNAIITSLLYKKHPNDLKIVLVDPKKVEFSIYAPIAKPFMAAVEENEDEPIITDVQKVVKTLKGLCVLMDNRYDMLKAAGARNIKEYNSKFLNHQLNPEEGHEFMPYIVVIIDEFGDLILTAGKEIEMPITRIAQLARAVGIHMIIATQRPTTSIITGNIKANFPGRIAFRVGAMMDSRIILDRPGAQQLVGRGDMLYLNGGEPTRVQCAFVDTPEVEDISKFIATQPGPVEPLLIPEPVAEDGGIAGGSLDENLDPLFEDAARTIVLNQQGSTSMIQRRFSIGYNRAGRLMDQMEKAGIVGAAQGSKPREVLIGDEMSLESLLATLHK